MPIEVKKEGKFLQFKIEDNVFMYNFSDNTYLKNGKKIKHPQTFFRGYSINDIVSLDEKYKNFINLVSIAEERCYNIGTFIERMSKYSNAESWIMIGCDPHYSVPISVSDINKRLLKIVKKYNIRPDSSLNRLRNNDTMLQILEYVDLKYEDKNIINNVYHDFDNRNNIQTLINLNYNYKALVDYIYKIYNYEALEIKDCLQLLKDYASMQQGMSKNGKFEKYPRYLNTTHDIITRNFNSFKKMYNEEIFKNRINNDLQFIDREFSIFTPKSSQCIKDEGVNLRHCVGSYVEKIINGECQVVFMRKKENESLVTIEIKNETIVQARGELNRNLLNEEMEFLNKYAKIKKLKIKI